MAKKFLGDNKLLILGGLAVASTSAYLYYRSREQGQSVNDTIEGVSIDIRPDALIDGMGRLVRMNPTYKEPLIDITKKVISKALGPQGGYEN